MTKTEQAQFVTMLKDHLQKSGRFIYSSSFSFPEEEWKPEPSGMMTENVYIPPPDIPFTAEYLLFLSDESFRIYDVQIGNISVLNVTWTSSFSENDGMPSELLTIKSFDEIEPKDRMRLSFDWNCCAKGRLLLKAAKPFSGQIVVLGSTRPLRPIVKEVRTVIHSVGMCQNGPCVDVSSFYDGGEKLEARIIVPENELEHWLGNVGKSAYVKVSLSMRLESEKKE